MEYQALKMEIIPLATRDTAGPSDYGRTPVGT